MMAIKPGGWANGPECTNEWAHTRPAERANQPLAIPANQRAKGLARRAAGFKAPCFGTIGRRAPRKGDSNVGRDVAGVRCAFIQHRFNAAKEREQDANGGRPGCYSAPNKGR